MAFVLCDQVSQGLRDSERSVAVKDVHGRRQFLRVEHDFLTVANGKTYLPVGLVYQDSQRQLALIEFPHEADSGANRLWVRLTDLLQDTGATT